MWQEIKIESWGQFSEVIGKQGFANRDWPVFLFRGQADASWSMHPSLTRILKSKDMPCPQAVGVENDCTYRFRSAYHQITNLREDSQSLIDWWMLMQHYSCPTRLLDWSLSPYVAAYFAVTEHPRNDGAIWLFDSSRLEKEVSKRFGNLDLDVEQAFGESNSAPVYTIVPLEHSPRSYAQQGVFTVSTNIASDHCESIAEIFRHESLSPPLKFVIPAQLKLEFSSQLHLMNITSASLFPGIDGLGRSVREFAFRRTNGYKY